MPITADENTTISDIIAALHGHNILMAIKSTFITPVGNLSSVELIMYHLTLLKIKKIEKMKKEVE